MKTHMKELAAFTLTSFLATTLIVACGQPQKGASVSKGKGSDVHADRGNQNAGVPGSTQNPQQAPRFNVNVTDSKPMIAIMKSAANGALDSFLNNPKASGSIDEKISLDLQLKNLQDSKDSSPGNGSVLVLQTVLNNSVDKPIPFTLQSNANTSMVILDGSKLTATFQFMDGKGKTVMLTAVLDGTLSTDDSADAKTFNGNLALTDSNNTKAQIGTFSIPLNQIMSSDDLEKLSSPDKDKTTQPSADDKDKDKSSDSDSDKSKDTSKDSDKSASKDASKAGDDTDTSGSSSR